MIKLNRCFICGVEPKVIETQEQHTDIRFPDDDYYQIECTHPELNNKYRGGMKPLRTIRHKNLDFVAGIWNKYSVNEEE